MPSGDLQTSHTTGVWITAGDRPFRQWNDGNLTIATVASTPFTFPRTRTNGVLANRTNLSQDATAGRSFQAYRPSNAGRQPSHLYAPRISGEGRPKKIKRLADAMHVHNLVRSVTDIRRNSALDVTYDRLAQL